jgi:hypothetical protein
MCGTSSALVLLRHPNTVSTALEKECTVRLSAGLCYTTASCCHTTPSCCGHWNLTPGTDGRRQQLLLQLLLSRTGRSPCPAHRDNTHDRESIICPQNPFLYHMAAESRTNNTRACADAKHSGVGEQTHCGVGEHRCCCSRAVPSFMHGHSVVAAVPADVTTSIVAPAPCTTSTAVLALRLFPPSALAPGEPPNPFLVPHLILL